MFLGVRRAIPSQQGQYGPGGVVKTNQGENSVEMSLPTAETDINVAYEDAIHVLSAKPPKEEKKVDAATAQEDYYRNFREKCATSLPHSRSC